MVFEEVTKLDKLDIIHEEGREAIKQWREKRLKKMAARKSYLLFYLHTFNLETLCSFAQNFNFMVFFQMLIAGVSVYLFQTYNISFDLHVTLFVSPIVFPLAFSIDADFQRREKVLEDLAQFKSSGMVWYFCMRDWKQAAELGNEWISAVQEKLRSVLFHLREYLLTYKTERRKIILRAVYEDFSDMNQLIEKLRASKLPSNAAIISRAIHLLNVMCLSFERLRVIREYRSPRSIRSFNKVLIMLLPIILAPYYVYLGNKSKNVWEPYYISILVAFVFSALQGVQDKLDDPFDGMSEDDINLDTFDEWSSSLEHTMKRTFAIGRFKVSVEEIITKQVRKSAFMEKDQNINIILNKNKSRAVAFPRSNKYLSSLGVTSKKRHVSVDDVNRKDSVSIQTDYIRPIPNERAGRYQPNHIQRKHFTKGKAISFDDECMAIPENNLCEIDDATEGNYSGGMVTNVNQKVYNTQSITETQINGTSRCKEDIRTSSNNNHSLTEVNNNIAGTGNHVHRSCISDITPNCIEEEETYRDTDEDIHTVLCEWNLLDAALRREMFAGRN